MRKSRPRRPSLGLRRFLGGALAVAVVLAALPALAGAAAGKPDCESRQAIDYAAPLVDMPGARPLVEGELPFGPRNFDVELLGWSHLALVGSNFGYWFSGKNNPYRVVDLGRRATATAWAVDRHGRVRREIGKREWKVGRIKELSKLKLGFPAERPGFARIDLRFTTLAGHELGSYRDYFRVLARSDDIAITIDRPSVHAGEAIVGQVENRGTVKMSGRSTLLEVERFADGGWEAVPQPPNPESVVGSRLFLGSGEASPCHGYLIPADATPGRYRLATTVHFAGLKRHELVSRTFDVAP